MTDIDLSSITIQSNGQTHSIPLTPALGSLSEARFRLVEMDKSAKAALGIKSQQVKRFTLPTKTHHKVVGGLVLFYLISWSLKGYVVPGSAPHNLLDKFWPFSGAEGYLSLQEKIVKPLIAIHAVECVVMGVRLWRAGVPTLGGLWWKWMFACSIEGVGSHERVSDEIKASKAAQ